MKGVRELGRGGVHGRRWDRIEGGRGRDKMSYLCIEAESKDGWPGEGWGAHGV